MPPEQTDTLYSSYSRGLYKITGSEAEDDILNQLMADPNATNTGSLTVAADSIDSGVDTSTTQASTGSDQSGKKTYDNTAVGYILGVDPKDGYAKFFIGNTTKYINWDGQNLTVVGGVSISSLDIPDTVTANSFHVDTQGNAWWGATTLGSATASVLKTGVATFTNITATGTINATAGYIGTATALVYESQGINTGTTGHIRGGQTAFNTGIGYFLGYESGQYKFSIGDATNNYLTWDGSNLTISGTQRVIKNFTAGEDLTLGDSVFVATSGPGTNTAITQASQNANQDNFGATYVAQTFTTDADVYMLVDITVKLQRVGAPNGNILFQIQTLSGANPSGVVLATQTKDIQTVSFSATDYTITFNLNVVPSHSYALVMIGPGSGVGNDHVVYYQNTNVYAGGAGLISSNSGGTWGNLGGGGATDVYITLNEKRTATGNIYKSSSLTTGFSNPFVGFVFATTSAAGTVPVILAGSALGLSGLTTGSFYYLADTAATIATSAGTNTRKVGLALSTTELLITNLW